jgi:hypothetical protein
MSAPCTLPLPFAEYKLAPPPALSGVAQVPEIDKLTDVRRHAVTNEEKTRYTDIINGILVAADLNTITRKQIREGLEAAIKKDTSDHKVRDILGPIFRLSWSLA